MWEHDEQFDLRISFSNGVAKKPSGLRISYIETGEVVAEELPKAAISDRKLILPGMSLVMSKDEQQMTTMTTMMTMMMVMMMSMASCGRCRHF